MSVTIPDAAMFSDPETQKKFASEPQQNAEGGAGKARLEAKVFCVVVTSTRLTRWLEHDEVLLRGVEARMRLYFEHLTEGQLPGVSVTLSKGEGQ